MVKASFDQSNRLKYHLRNYTYENAVELILKMKIIDKIITDQCVMNVFVSGHSVTRAEERTDQRRLQAAITHDHSLENWISTLKSQNTPKEGTKDACKRETFPRTRTLQA